MTESLVMKEKSSSYDDYLAIPDVDLLFRSSSFVLYPRDEKGIQPVSGTAKGFFCS